MDQIRGNSLAAARVRLLCAKSGETNPEAANATLRALKSFRSRELSGNRIRFFGWRVVGTCSFGVCGFIHFGSTFISRFSCG